MKITGILVLVAIMSLFRIFSGEKFCGTQPLRKKEWKYDVDSKRKGRILNGKDSHAAEWPWQALLEQINRLQTEIGVVCGGSLITENHVLTAAHCKPKTDCKLRVILGANVWLDFKEPHRVVREVLRTISHEEYSEPRIVNDIQVIVMDKPVKFTKYILPICFSNTDEDFSSKNAWTTGWGLTNELDNSSFAKVLQKVATPIWKYSRCDAWVSQDGMSKPGDAAGKLCTGYDDIRKGPCMGDSGGPLVIERLDGHWTQVGISSYGTIFHAQPRMLTVYMRVTYYRDWIEKQIKTTLFND